MKRFLAWIVFALAISPAVALAQGNHEYSPLVEKTVNYKNWTLNDLKDNKPVDLRSLVNGKSSSWLFTLRRGVLTGATKRRWLPVFYEKYKAQGFGVIGVSEYGMRDAVANFFGPNGSPYPVVSESELREDKQRRHTTPTARATGDKRNWGSPWNIFLDPATFAKTGDVLTEKAWVVNGELIEADVDKFIADHLKASTAAAIVPCKQ